MNAIKLSDLDNLTVSQVEEELITIENIFKDYPSIILNEKELQQFFNGVKLKKEETEGIYKIYNDKDEFIGTGELKKNN
ncbi:MAG: hypothetical protein HFJ51_04265, partial [Clostridia bacterium]|nr:hypothetical protein [Clostridia bacterium]